ncbi:MAG: SRPBCC domain-containing protein [Leptolyngbyaceae cyanobacterium MO_188.B28]|nr:SRPBCC domain-containing protein [Leptolyngbyaceae cyanobacterium MO_188.B28]
MSTTITLEDGFSVTTRINASPDVLYRAWTEKADIESWLATEAEVDARLNGNYILKWPSPDGELSARGEYLKLVPGERIVQSWQSWGPEGRFEGGDATVQIEFVDLGDGSTEMTQTEWSPVYMDKDHVDMSIKGTIQAHEALARFIESGKPQG